VFYGRFDVRMPLQGVIRQGYLAKESGPLLDRIYLHIEVPAVA
jgi:hypothetical protein